MNKCKNCAMAIGEEANCTDALKGKVLCIKKNAYVGKEKTCSDWVNTKYPYNSLP